MRNTVDSSGEHERQRSARGHCVDNMRRHTRSETHRLAALIGDISELKQERREQHLGEQHRGVVRGWWRWIAVRETTFLSLGIQSPNLRRYLDPPTYITVSLITF